LWYNFQGVVDMNKGTQLICLLILTSSCADNPRSSRLDEQGRKFGEERYIEGTNRKEDIQRYGSGRIEHVWRSREGKRDGLQEGWYKNGQKQYEWQYLDGKQSGTQVGWYENGQMDYQGSYVNGQRNGQWEWWYENGQKMGQATFVNGKKDGICIEWHENGVKSFWEECTNGVRVGHFVTWDWKGRIDSNAIYALRDKHVAIIERAIEVKLFKYQENPVILREPKDIAKISSALKLEPLRNTAKPGQVFGDLFFNYAQFITENGQILRLSGNLRQFNVNSDVGSGIYLPSSNFLAVVKSYTGQLSY